MTDQRLTSAQQALVSEHYRLALYLAHRYTPRQGGNRWNDDMRSTALMCLINCAQHFDADQNVPFIAYVNYKLPLALIDHWRFLNRGCRSPKWQAEISFDSLVAKENHPSMAIKSLDEIVCNRALSQEVVQAISKLKNPIDVRVAQMYFIDGMKLKEVGEHMIPPVTESRICQRLSKIRIDLRSAIGSLEAAA